MDIKQNYKGSNKIVDSQGLYENLKNLDSRRQEKLHSSLYHNETITVVDQEENYIACTSSDLNALEVINDSIATPVDGQVALSVVQTFVPAAQVGEYYQHIEKIEHDEEIEKTTFMPREETYDRSTIDAKIVASQLGVEPMSEDEFNTFWDGLTITASGYVDPTQP